MTTTTYDPPECTGGALPGEVLTCGRTRPCPQHDQPEPSTAIELPAQPPECPSGHGPMVLRSPPRGHTPEQRWCGVWYDCAPGEPGQTCKSSVLIPSPELLATKGSRPAQPALPF